jgi:exopolyphosphatase/guanosine-5'-triphosphate,3'-diphosphate pyrophosphatase
MLLRGLSLDAINEEDNRKKELSVENCKFLVDNAWKFAKRCGLDFEHYSQVTRLALKFFDGLKEVHQLSERERCWLECAGILHDIGLSVGRQRHNKESAKIILHDTKLPFTSLERQIVASIARYHRKGLPKNRHYNLAALDQAIIQKVKVLSGMLRVADALDYTHQSNVENLELKVSSKKIIVTCFSKTQSILEEQAFNKKKDLFENFSGKQLVLRWKQN